MSGFIRLSAASLICLSAYCSCQARAADLTKHQEEVAAAEWALSMCRNTPPRFRSNCQSERARYEAAVKEHREPGRQ